MNEKNVIRKVASLLESRGIALWKLGEVLGSRGSQSAKIDRANRFLSAKQKSVSMAELSKLCKFFEKPLSYFIDLPDAPLLAEKKADYGPMTAARIDKMKEKEINALLFVIEKTHPEILAGTPKDTLSNSAKRTIIKAYYRI